MFQELRSMRRNMTGYYTLVLVLFTFLLNGFVLYNVFSSNGFVLDRELRVNAVQVNDLHTIPEVDQPPEPRDRPNSEKGADAVFKFILRNHDLEVTQSSIHYQALFDQSKQSAMKTMVFQKQRWDTLEVNGNRYRIYSRPFNRNGETGVVQTYCNLTMLARFAGRFTNMLIAVALIAVLLAALVGWWLAARAMVPVELAWKRQKEFIADVSHELRTPLTIIQSNLDVAIADENGSIQENKLWLQNAYSATSSMGKLVNDLLLLARIDARDIQFDKSEFDLSYLLTEVSAQFKPVYQTKQISFSADIEDKVTMHGDPVRIRQMVSVFLDNAFQYTAEGGNVQLRMEKTPHLIEIVIADNGIGFEETEKDKIFMRFYRVDKARSRKQGGTGLGLAIAAWIAGQHKGSIQVASKAGQGSVFKVLLPLS